MTSHALQHSIRSLCVAVRHPATGGGGPVRGSVLARFDCDLSLDVDWPVFKNNNLRFSRSTHLQPRLRLPNALRRQIVAEQDRVDRDSLGTTVR